MVPPATELPISIHAVCRELGHNESFYAVCRRAGRTDGLRKFLSPVRRISTNMMNLKSGVDLQKFIIKNHIKYSRIGDELGVSRQAVEHWLKREIPENRHDEVVEIIRELGKEVYDRFQKVKL